MQQFLEVPGDLEASLPAERARLVRLCAALTGHPEVAEDLAQETLLEAWRHLQSLRDPTRRAQWLSGIARNICLRWTRAHLHTLAQRAEDAQPSGALFTDLAETLADEENLEEDLERQELADLVERALALLPPETRALLIKRYLEQSPLAEVAAQAGLSESVAAMRLQRGKGALRRVLTTTFANELAPYRGEQDGASRWETTRLWCSICGQHHLLGRFAPEAGDLFLACPGCGPYSTTSVAQTSCARLFQGVKGYRPALSRLLAWCERYYRPALAARRVPCLHCGRAIPLQQGVPVSFPDHVQGEQVLFHQCPSCGATCWISLEFLVLALPAGRQFWQAHPRLRLLPSYEVEAEGQPAIVTRFESVTSAARFEVVSAQNTYELLRLGGSR